MTVLNRLKSLLKPGGVILAAYMPRHARARDEDALWKGRQVGNYLRQAWFAQITTHTRMMKPVVPVAQLAGASQAVLDWVTSHEK